MGWPDNTTLPVEIYAAFGADPAGDPGDWTFTDLTSRWQENPAPISIRRGASDGAGEVAPSTVTMDLLNDDGALTPLYPMSEYWPDVVLGTPIRVAIRRAEDDFSRTSTAGWGAAPSGQVWTNEGTATNYPVAGGVGQHRHTVVNTLRRTVLDSSLTDTEQLIDVSTPVTITGATLVTGVMARYDAGTQDYYWLRCEFNADGTVTAKLGRSDAGVLTDLVSATVPALSYATDTPLRLRASTVGTKLAVKVWLASGTEPAGWHVEYTDSNPIPGPGQVGVQSWLVTGNTNVLPLLVSYRNYKVLVDRMNGFADQWQPTFTPTSDGEVVSTVRLTASGILRRLGQGKNPLYSALRRAILDASGVVGYWALEGGKDIGTAASTLPGGAALAPIGTVTPDFGQVEGPPGSDALPDLTSHGVLVGPVTPYTHTGEWQVEFWFRTDPGDSLDFTASVPLQWDTPDGTIVAWDMLLFVGQGDGNPGLGNIGFDVGAYTAPPGGGDPGESQRMELLYVAAAAVPSVQGSWHQVRVTAEQVTGTLVEMQVYLNGTLMGTASDSSWTIGPVTRVTVNPLQGSGAYAGVDGLGLSSVGHVVVYNTLSNPGTYTAGLGHAGETASTRISALCTEEGIPVTVVGGTSETMGPQGIDTLLGLLRECERADMGILYEHGWGLGYRPRVSRYNQTPALSVDLSTYRRTDDVRQDQVVAPTYDDQGVRNDWTVSRVNGSSAQVVDAEHATRHGTYDDSVELNLASDTRLRDHAGWRVGLGTWPEMRYPDIPVDLTANPDLIDDWLSLAVGDRAQQTSIPAPHPADDVDQLAGQLSETLAPGRWSGRIVGTPARPWDVAVAGGTQRAGAVGSTIGSGIDTDDLSFSLTSTARNGVWTTDPTKFPLDVVLGGGEVVTLSGITGTSSPQTATVSARAVNGVSRSWDAGTDVTVRRPARAAL